MSSIKTKQTLDDVSFESRTVFLRVDFNVPFNSSTITDFSRIDASCSTLNKIISSSPKAIFLISHLGRPNGKVNEKYSFQPLFTSIANRIFSNKINCKIGFSKLDFNSKEEANTKFDIEKYLSETKFIVNKNDSAEKDENSFAPIILFENIRFFPEEESKNIHSIEVKRFRNFLSSMADIFVFDAFGAIHRPHSSVSGLDTPIRVSGLLVSKELEKLEAFYHVPPKNNAVILGGAKVSDKLGQISNLVSKTSTICIGGAMANTFYYNLPKIDKSRNLKIGLGESLVEKDEKMGEYLSEIYKKVKENDCEIVLPIDFKTNKYENVEIKVLENKVELILDEDDAIMDIGSKTVSLFSDKLKNKEIIFWNGPMGKFEDEKYAAGTERLLEEVNKLGCEVIIGGGDTAAAAHKNKQNLSGDKIYICTGGGASLEFFAGKILPGLEALSDKKN